MIARLLALLCVLAVLASIDPAVAANEPRVALVIGNSEYGPEIGKLKNPANDAKLMAETLKGLGFQVDLVLDIDQKGMKRAVKNFGAKLRAAGSEADNCGGHTTCEIVFERKSFRPGLELIVK